MPTVFDNSSGQIAIGTILPYGSESVPSGFLECNGASVSRTTYAALFLVIGATFGDGSKNADGTSSGHGSTTYFNLPDMRGRFIRGWDHSAGRDPDTGGRVQSNDGGIGADHVGSLQDDDYKAHTHGQTIHPQGANGSYGSSTDNSGTLATEQTQSSGGSTETRPKNINAMYIIKY